MKVAVLFGGNSSERDVSIASGAQVAKALRNAGHRVIAVDTFRGVLSEAEQQSLLSRGVAPEPPTEQELQVVRAKTGGIVQAAYFGDADVVFLALHGGTGEDGTIQAVFSAAEIAYTGSDHVGSAAAMDKDLAKRLFLARGIPTPQWLMAPVNPADACAQLGLPLVVKPNKQGSTIGLSIVTTASAPIGLPFSFTAFISEIFSSSGQPASFTPKTLALNEPSFSLSPVEQLSLPWLWHLMQ